MAEVQRLHADFAEFEQAFDKLYETPEERLHRVGVFKANMDHAARLNEEHAGDAKFGATQFSDLTPQEFQQRYAQPNFSRFLPTNRHANNTRVWHSSSKAALAYPAALDWRTQNGVSAVQNQGTCGDCWAFASNAELEGYYKRKFNKVIPLSAQQLVDCNTANKGCNGGNPVNVFPYMTKGVMANSEYPYKMAASGKCSFNPSHVVMRTASSTVFTASLPVQNLFNFLNTHGPATAALDSSLLQHYQTGILKTPDAQCPTLDHAVLLVGYDSTYTNLGQAGYFIVKNSWGATWGEQGFFRMWTGSCKISTLIQGLDGPTTDIDHYTPPK